MPTDPWRTFTGRQRSTQALFGKQRRRSIPSARRIRTTEGLPVHSFYRRMPILVAMSV